MPRLQSEWRTAAVPSVAIRATWHFTLESRLQIPDPEEILFAETELFWEIITLCKKDSCVRKADPTFQNCKKRVKLISSVTCHVARHTSTLPRVATKGPQLGEIGSALSSFSVPP